MKRKKKMNKICYLCKNQRINLRDTLAYCLFNETENQGYGFFIRGAKCKYDALLEDLFNSKEQGKDKAYDNLLKTLDDSFKENFLLKNEIINLQNIILKISSSKE